MHPFRALGKNSELLVVSDKADVTTWQRGSLPLHWANRLSTLTATEANHTRYVRHPRDIKNKCPNMCSIVFKVYLFDWELKLSPHFKVLLHVLCFFLLWVNYFLDCHNEPFSLSADVIPLRFSELWVRHFIGL